MKNSAIIFIMLVINTSLLGAQNAPNSASAQPAEDYSGLYAFLQEGEFVQLTVEEQGRVTGFISRYGDSGSDKGTFLDQFFKQGKLEGKKLTFTTETVHEVWYDFQGVVERGDGKNTGYEGYYVLKGKLTTNRTDTNKKTTAKSQEVAFKSFPKETDSVSAP
jgi:hypothetical protein